MKSLKILTWLFLTILGNSMFSLAQSRRPNILVIFTDDHTQQAISAYGSKLMQTPNIDRIAQAGVIFNNSFVTNSICAPSRAVFLTGKYSHLNGLRDNSPQRRFDGSQQQVQKLLKGYQTAWIGKWHLQTLPQGFDYWTILPEQGHYYQPDFITMNNDTVRKQGYVTKIISDYAIEWLEKRDTTEPFFLVVGEKATHRTWMPEISDLGEFDDTEFQLPENFFDDYAGRRAAQEQDMMISKTLVMDYDLKVNVNYQKDWMYNRLTPEQKQAYERYYSKVSAEYEKIKGDSLALVKWKYQRYLRDYLSTARSLDRNIGRILNYLESAKLDKNTIVIYTSDQGFYMGEHGWFDKRFMYEESLRTPLIIKYPGLGKPGTAVNDMVVNIDLAPTILQAAGAGVPADMQGKSMVPLLRGDSKGWRQSMYYHYYEYPEPHRVSPHFGIRNEQYKLIRFYGPYDAWELFDIRQDKMEMNNLYGNKSYQSVVEKLKKELQQLAEHYGDREAVKVIQGKN